MSTTIPTLAGQASDERRIGRGVLLLTVTAAITFFVTGSGMLEGHAVYPSWLNLAVFPGFAGYHAAYGNALLPWLPIPLVLATALNAWLVFRRPTGVPPALLMATLAGQLVVIGVTVAFALPIQAQLATAGRTPAEITALVESLIRINYWREIPGLAVAAGFVVMLRQALRARA